MCETMCVLRATINNHLMMLKQRDMELFFDSASWDQEGILSKFLGTPTPVIKF